jgi:ABC-2 type transport system ATP-binding protein
VSAIAPESKTATDAGHESPMIEVRNLCRSFGKVHAVRDISFTVNRGQVFGYIGPNGAGKTTSMRILATLEQPSSGDALIDGFSVLDDPDRVRSRLGFMPDAFAAQAAISVREYLDFFARSYHLAGNERRERLEWVMGFTKLDGLANKATNSLSKGMKQRLCLGRALIHDPAVLIMDEPAAGLDPRARIQLRQMIRQLADHGRTVLISSHILTELAEMCDRVAIIEQGSVLAVGTVDEIERRGQQMARRVIIMRVLGSAQALGEWIATRPDFQTVAVLEDHVQLTHEGTSEAEADLLAAAIADGFRIVEFTGRKRSLEDVFMDVTEGLVQ